jgi:hypothetical protein
MTPADNLFEDIRRYIQRLGVAVRVKNMDIETPGCFDGLTITINPRHDAESSTYYVLHALGSIVQWSTDGANVSEIFRSVKDQRRQRDRRGFEAALVRYHRFEEISSEHAVWVLGDAGHDAAIAPYTTFFRADLEAMMILHRTGKAPRWADFYADWKRGISTGRIRLEPFASRPIPSFTPVCIENTEIVQEHD